MRRLIHLFMGIDRDKAAEAERTPAFEERLRTAMAELEGELHAALSHLSAQLSERNRVRAEVERLRTQSTDLRAQARRLVASDEAHARMRLSSWADLQPVIEDAAEQLERLNQACISAEGRVIDLRRKLEESNRNTNTLIARRSATRAQQRLADAVAAGRDQQVQTETSSHTPQGSASIDVEAELDKLRGENKG